jgi:hypothetical protein
MPITTSQFQRCFVVAACATLLCIPARAESVFPTTEVNIRPCPNASSRCEPFATIPPGTELTVLQQNGNWIFVRQAGGREGWVSAKYTAAQPNRSDQPIPQDREMTVMGFRLTPPWAISASSLQFGVLPMSTQTFISTVNIFSFFTTFAFYLGLMMLIGRKFNVPQQQLIGAAVVLTVICGVMGVLAINYVIAVLAFGFLGTLLGGAGFGGSLRSKVPAGILAGILTLALFVTSFVISSNLEVRCIIAVLLAADAGIAAVAIRRMTYREPAIFAATLNGPFILLALFGGFLVLPVMAPQWVFVQPAIFLIGILFGLGGLALD